MLMLKEKPDLSPTDAFPEVPPPEHKSKKFPTDEAMISRYRVYAALLIGGIIILILLGFCLYLLLSARHHAATKTYHSTPPANKTTAQGVQLDPSKNYGNKYTSGLLPVGDNKMVTDAAKTGNIYACSAYADSTKRTAGGAGLRGPWFTNNNEYDVNKKLHVSGKVSWQASFTNNLTSTQRVITTNDLPNHPTGVFPIARSDAAYAYDRNPNSIKSQSLTYTLATVPTYGAPQCTGGEVGIMLTGVPIFNGFDAAARDAGAWEIQDDCAGHPQVSGEYHYHTLSSCIKDVGVSQVIGFALDGFPITGPTVGTNNYLTTSDLDECHGLTSEITLDGKKVTTYHYVMTEDFPYSVSCFRSTAAQPPRSQ